MSVVWLNGAPGTGKTTLAYALRALVHPVSAVALLDEDVVAQAILDAPQVSGSAGAPTRNQLSGTALVLAQQGFVVVVTASDTPAAISLWNRANLPGYREVLLRASPETVKHRSRRRPQVDRPIRTEGPPEQVPGEPGEVGPAPDLMIDMDNPEPPELLAFRVAVLVPEYVLAAAGAAGIDARRLRRGA